MLVARKVLVVGGFCPVRRIDENSMVIGVVQNHFLLTIATNVSWETVVPPILPPEGGGKSGKVTTF